METGTAEKVHCPVCRGCDLFPYRRRTSDDIESLRAQSVRTWTEFDDSSEIRELRYWICAQCGEKFRNKEDLENEITIMEATVKYNRSRKPFAIGIIIFSTVCFLIFWRLLLLTFVPLSLLVFGCIMMLISGQVQQKEYEALLLEREYLQKHCFEESN